MDSCLLCLEINKEFVDNIKVNSILWQEQNIKKIIEKHFWAMETILPSSSMCKICWKELHDFHKFYMRIEEAHVTLGTVMKNETRLTEYMENNAYYNHLDDKDLFCTGDLVESHMEPEILMEQPISTEFLVEDQESLIKQEQEDDLCSDDMPLKRRRKRGRSPKDLKSGENNNKKDPLQKIKKCRKPKISSTKSMNSNEILLNINSSLIESHEESLIKDDPDALNQLKDGTLSFDSHHDNDDSDSDSNYQDDKKPREAKHKKRKNPDEQTRREHDKIIADNFQIFCSLCQIPLDNFIALRKHFRVEHKKRGFVICCKRKIFTRPVLVDHIHFHLDPDYFKCKKCDKVLSERSTLESHMKTHVDGQQERKHTCDLCGKSFKENATLENHKLTHSADYEKKYSCTECGKFFTTLYSLNYHIQAIHHNKFVKICDICGKTMRCRNSFKLHMEKHENKHGTPITCDICGLRLVDRRGLRRHKNSQHPVGGKKEYTCHICSKISPNSRALRTHIRFAHEVGYDHKCTMCDKAFKRPEALKEHMATHTGTALYACPWCPKTFISNGNMHTHRKKSHPIEWEEAQRQKYSGNLPTNYKPPVATNINNLL